MEGKQLIDNYYESKGLRLDNEHEGTEEADKVAARITEILSEKSFSFTPDYLFRIHQRLFEGVYSYAGKIRQKNITKEEWILDRDTVTYSGYDMIRQTLEYDFTQEKGTDYPSMTADQANMGKHFVKCLLIIIMTYRRSLPDPWIIEHEAYVTNGQFINGVHIFSLGQVPHIGAGNLCLIYDFSQPMLYFTDQDIPLHN